MFKNKKKMHFTYILKCADNSLYAGVTTDVKRREKEHNSEKKGAKYTRARRPVNLVYKKAFKTKSEAMKEESRIKRLSRKEKLALIGEI